MSIDSIFQKSIDRLNKCEEELGNINGSSPNEFFEGLSVIAKGALEIVRAPVEAVSYFAKNQEKAYEELFGDDNSDDKGC